MLDEEPPRLELKITHASQLDKLTERLRQIRRLVGTINDALAQMYDGVEQLRDQIDGLTDTLADELHQLEGLL